MEFRLTLELPEAEQEAVWLRERILDDAIDGLSVEVQTLPAAEGTMAGDLMTEVLQLTATTAVAEIIKSVIQLIFDHFQYKPAKLELAGQCPDNGNTFKMTIDTSKSKDRDVAIEEFNRLMSQFCGPNADLPNE